MKKEQDLHFTFEPAQLSLPNIHLEIKVPFAAERKHLSD